MADKQIKDFTAQSPVEYTNKYVTQDVSNNTKYTQHSVLLGGWHGGANRWSDNAYYDGAWKYRTTGYAASMYNNSGTLEFYSNTGSAGAAISWNSANILAKKITSNDTTDSSSTSTGSGVFSGGVGIAKKLYVGTDGHFAGILYGDNTTNSTSSITGCAVFSGGVGIAKNIYTAGDMYIQGGNLVLSSVAGCELDITSPDANQALINLNGTSGKAWRITRYGSTNAYRLERYVADVFQDVIYFCNNATGATSFEITTDSSSSITGSVQFAGGVGIAKKLYVGTDSHTAGVLYGDSVTDSSSISTGGSIFAGGVGIAKKLYVGGIGNFTNTTDSTSASTGGCIFSGGVGIAKKLYVGGITYITDTTGSFSTSTGCLVLSGGLGVAANTYIGGVVRITDTTESINTSTGCLVLSGGLGVAGFVYAGTVWSPVIYGLNTTTDASAVIGICSVGTSAKGVEGNSASGYGVHGTSSAVGGTGVYGINSAVSGSGIGVYGKGYGYGMYAESTGGMGIYATGGSSYGVQGISTASNSYGVYGIANTGSTATGVYGESSSGLGVKGVSTLSDGTGVRGDASTGTSAKGVIGFSASGIGVYGSGATYDFYAGGAGTDYGSSSSIRWKDKVKVIENPLELIEKIRGVRYKDNRHKMIDKIGYIAEEIRDVLPEIVVEEDPKDKDNWYKEDGKKKLYCSGLDYSKMGPLHTEAIKELYKIVKSLEMLIKEKK